MASRKIRSEYEGHSRQAPGVIRHSTHTASSHHAVRGVLELPTPPELLENRIASQAAEIEQLAGDKLKLVASQCALREDLAAARQEAQKLKEHIKSTQTESDIQIRVLHDKIAKMEAAIQVGESMKKELQQAYVEAQTLVKARQELVAQIRQASLELEKTHADVKTLPELHAELEGLRKEHHKLHITFQYEKSFNIEQVNQMQAMEKNLIEMAGEVEKLRAEVSSAETRGHGPLPNSGGYMKFNPSYMPPLQGFTTYFDRYGQPVMQMNRGTAEGMIPYGSSANIPATNATNVSVGQAAQGSVWRARYDHDLLGGKQGEAAM